MDAPFDAEVMEQVGDLQLDHIFEREQIEDTAVDSGLQEGVLKSQLNSVDVRLNLHDSQFDLASRK